jgi:biopolymer transport protein ExbD
MSKSILQTTSIRGPLSSQGVVKPKGQKTAKNLIFSLNLTALIDTFSILVIFLLSIFNGDAQNLNFNSKITLPTATRMEILNMGTIVRVEGNQYFIDEEHVLFSKLVEKLIQVKQAKKNEPEDIKNALIIQADRQLSFEELSPVIRAGGQAGFNQYKFAVLPQISQRN